MLKIRYDCIILRYIAFIVDRTLLNKRKSSENNEQQEAFHRSGITKTEGIKYTKERWRREKEKTKTEKGEGDKQI
jgi:hypothetical protein